MEVEHVKAHRIKMDKKDMSQFEKFVVDGNEKTDELAKAGAMLAEGLMAQTRAKTVRQEREDACAALQYAASSHCLVEDWNDCEEKWIFVDKKREETKHGTEWCAVTSRYRCVRCGRGSKVQEDVRKMHRAEISDKELGKMG